MIKVRGKVTYCSASEKGTKIELSYEGGKFTHRVKVWLANQRVTHVNSTLVDVVGEHSIEESTGKDGKTYKNLLIYATSVTPVSGAKPTPPPTPPPAPKAADYPDPRNSSNDDLPF